ncbi:NEK1 [Symbiodinium natans]|uniref:non-specific serine/threonine protein kinase n=1 Tax=Symbiodinium natans TaxID=878477 RepID=A0A812QIC7_9DINO|nr:NEK1 [Symbiodinium natans]
MPSPAVSMGPFRLLDEARSAYAQWSAVSDDELAVQPPPRTMRALATPASRRLGQRLAAPGVDAADVEDVANRGGHVFGNSSGSSARPDEGKFSSGVEEHAIRGPNGQKVDSGDLLSLHAGQAASKPVLSPRIDASPRAHGGSPLLKVDLSGLPMPRGFSKGSSMSKVGFDEKGGIMPDTFGGQLRFRDNHTQSTLGSAFESGEADSAYNGSDSWAKKPRDAAYAALRYLGLLPTAAPGAPKPGVPLASSVVGQLLELALGICFASAADCALLAEKASVEDKKALQRLRALADRVNLLGRGVVVSTASKATLSPAELVTAFLDASASQQNNASRASSPTGRQPGYGRKDSNFSQMSKPSLLRNRTNSRVRFDATDSPRAASPGSPIEARSGFNRSQSDFSCTSFTDFNRKQATARKDTDIAAPAFLEFLIVVLKGGQEQRIGAVSPPSPLGNGAASVAGGGDVVLDLKLDNDFGRLVSNHPEDDNASAMTYHSYCDAMVTGAGGEGEEKEVISAEVVKLGGTEGKQTMRIAFKSKCLRTQNEWQKQLLAQQRALLDVVTGRLQAAERTLKEDEEVKEEERELLRGFRKIVRRERGSTDTQLPAEIFVVEKRQKLREEAEELCRILTYPCQTFHSFSRAMEALQEASQETIQRVVSLVSRGSAHSMVSARGADLLDGRPGDDLPDWRCRALCTTGRGAGNQLIERPSQIVFLGMAWLMRGLPEEWQQQGVYVVLITEADEFEEVGRQLLASGEGEIREKLRAKGICDYLIHPLSLDSLSKVISEAVQRRLEEYLLLDMLGRGATACVHKAKRLRDNETIALKEINMRRLKNANEEIERELKLLRELSWPTVVFTLDTWENRTEQLRYVVMPLLDGGSMQQRIEAARGAESEEVQHSDELVADWYVQTLHGLAYLHWRGVIHRDIKPGNLLIAEDGRLLQIGDLGSAMLLPGTGPFPNPHAKVVAPVTSPSYASPEALLQETYYAASDLWCVGVSFFEALTLHPLFPDVQSMAEAQDHVRAFDPSMVGPTNGATNYAVAALSVLNQLRCSSSSTQATVELAGELPELVRPDLMQRPTASGIASRYFCIKRIKTILKETGAVPKGMVSTHLEDYKALLKQSQAARNTTPDAAGVHAVHPTSGFLRFPKP